METRGRRPAEGLAGTLGRRRLVVAVLLCTAGLCAACASAPAESIPRGDGPSALQRQLVAAATELLGRQRLEVCGREFALDCSGLVRALYFRAGLDLDPLLSAYTGGGVTRLYRLLEDRGLLHRELRPQPGDIVFWDHSYDRDGDGRRNDELTHVGMVVAVSAGEKIDYIHYNYRSGIVIEHMDLSRPDVHTQTADGATVVVNSPMRMRQAGGVADEEWLSGQLFRTFGRGYLLAGE